MSVTRRSFLKLLLATSAIVSCSTKALAASVALDAQSTSPAQFNTGFTSPQTDTSLTIGASATSLLVWVSLGGVGGSLATCTGCTWNSVSMTLLATIVSGGSTETLYLFGLVNPATGNHTISASFSGSTATCSGGIFGVSWKGTDATSTATCFPTANILTDSSVSVSGLYPSSPFSVTTASGDAACAGMNAFSTDFPSMHIGTFLAELDNFDANATYGYSLASGTTTQLQFQGSGSGFSCCGIALRIVQGGGGPPPSGGTRRSLTGVGN